MKNFSAKTYGIVGAISFSLFCTMLIAAFTPAIMGDGQFGMIYMLLCPIGWIAGCVIGTISNADAEKANVGCGTLFLGTIVFFLFGPFILLALLMPIGLIIELIK